MATHHNHNGYLREESAALVNEGQINIYSQNTTFHKRCLYTIGKEINLHVG